MYECTLEPDGNGYDDAYGPHPGAWAQERRNAKVCQRWDLNPVEVESPPLDRSGTLTIKTFGIPHPQTNLISILQSYCQLHLHPHVVHCIGMMPFPILIAFS